jgi:hypothetical protein
MAMDILNDLYYGYVILESKIDTSNFTYFSHLGGSTGASLYVDNKTGSEWVVKFGGNIDHMYNEYLSNKIYSKYGINVPESFIGEIDGRRCLVTEYLKDSISVQEAVNSGRHINIPNEIGKGFLFDVIMANWDVVGSRGDMSNIRVTPDGRAWRVDLGGSTIYRARGDLKGSAFGEVPTEHKTLRDSSSTAADFFKHITDDNIRERLKEEAKRYVISGDKISHVKFLRDLRSTIFNDPDANLPDNTKQQIYRTIAKRVFNIYRIFN